MRDFFYFVRKRKYNFYFLDIGEGEGIVPNLDQEYEDLVNVLVEQGDNPEVVAKAKERIKEIKEIKQSIKEG